MKAYDEFKLTAKTQQEQQHKTTATGKLAEFTWSLYVVIIVFVQLGFIEIFAILFSSSLCIYLFFAFCFLFFFLLNKNPPKSNYGKKGANEKK